MMPTNGRGAGDIHAAHTRALVFDILWTIIALGVIKEQVAAACCQGQHWEVVRHFGGVLVWICRGSRVRVRVRVRFRCVVGNWHWI